MTHEEIKNKICDLARESGSSAEWCRLHCYDELAFYYSVLHKSYYDLVDIFIQCDTENDLQSAVDELMHEALNNINFYNRHDDKKVQRQFIIRAECIRKVLCLMTEDCKTSCMVCNCR